MCGIVVVDRFGPGPMIPPANFIKMLRDSADRGQDSTGVAVVTSWQGGFIKKHTALGDVENWVRTCPAEFWAAYANARFVLAVNRAQPVPEGDSSNKVNRQPFVVGDWVGVHNGTFGNDRELKAQYSLSTVSQVDTEVGLALLDLILRDGVTEDKIKDWARKLSGGMTFFACNAKTQDWVVAKNFKPLCYVEREYYRIWASERKTLELVGESSIHWVPPYTAFLNDTNKPFPIETLHETSIPEADYQKALVVTSGGIDSTTAAYVAQKLHGKEVGLLHFDYGQVARYCELDAVSAAAQDLGCNYRQVDISWMGNLTNSPLVDSSSVLPLGIKSVETTGCWVPARNLIMLSIAAGICEALGYGCIYSGFNLEESGVYPDNDIEFLKVFNLALEYGTLRRPRLVLALERLMKPEIVKLGHYLGVPFKHTWSCDRGGDKPCGQCGCCWMRQFAFKKAGVLDEQVYENAPLENAPWVGEAISNVAPIGDILHRVKEQGLEDLIR